MFVHDTLILYEPRHEIVKYCNLKHVLVTARAAPPKNLAMYFNTQGRLQLTMECGVGYLDK